jgi:hypothetical protein
MVPESLATYVGHEPVPDDAPFLLGASKPHLIL